MRQRVLDAWLLRYAGHNACEACIRECLNRRHICPICNTETTQDKLVKNHHLDSLFGACF